MIKIANTQFWVHDQDEALAFYTKKLGWEVRSDVTMEAWSFRWLCVGPPGQDGAGLVLMPVPGSPMLDAESSAQLAELVAKGAGGTLFLETDDCQAAYDDLSARGVKFNDPPPPSRTASTRRSATVRQQHPAHPGAGVRPQPGLGADRRASRCARLVVHRHTWLDKRLVTRAESQRFRRGHSRRRIAASRFTAPRSWSEAWPGRSLECVRGGFHTSPPLERSTASTPATRCTRCPTSGRPSRCAACGHAPPRRCAATA